LKFPVQDKSCLYVLFIIFHSMFVFLWYKNFILCSSDSLIHFLLASTPHDNGTSFYKTHFILIQIRCKVLHSFHLIFSWVLNSGLFTWMQTCYFASLRIHVFHFSVPWLLPALNQNRNLLIKILDYNENVS